jgi:RNA polymerase sigma factor (sigma-70 family)
MSRVDGMASGRGAEGRSVSSQAGLLARIAVDRDRSAFAPLFRCYAPRLVHYFEHRGLDRDAADDLAQEVMVAVWARASQFDPRRGPPSAWIFAIARSHLVDSVRRERRFEGIRLRAREEHQAIPAPPVPMEQRLDLVRALAELPAAQATVLQDAYLAGRSMSEMAAISGSPLGTIKTRARLGLSRLRGLL